jgi:hypothetical protein
VPLHEPLDVESEQRHRKRAARQHLGRYRLRGPDRLAAVAEARVELRPEPLEELDVLGLLARKLDERPCPVAVAGQPRPRVIQHERQDELLDEPEHNEVAKSSDLVQSPLLAL